MSLEYLWPHRLNEVEKTFLSFLDSNAPPPDFETIKVNLSKFILPYKETQRPIVLITSGGTTAPIEAQTVRFLDNFSLGRRGAVSAEYFLESDYGVIFLHRQNSLCPFTRHFDSHSILELLEVSDNHLSVNRSHETLLKEVLLKKQKYHSKLLRISFTTITDYIFLLQESILQLCSLKSKALIYLAAAASDFYIPPQLQAKNKLHTHDKLVLEFYPVPKILGLIKAKWAPDAFLITFKLETDPDQLVHRAQRALNHYHHELVIANLLPTRHAEVRLISANDIRLFSLSSTEISLQVDLESKFIPEVVELHKKWIHDSMKDKILES